MSGSNITPVITPTALTNHFCTILNITINMKDVSMNNLINTEVLAYYKRCHMEVKICILHSLGQSEALLLLFLSNGQRVGSKEIICHHPVTRTSPQIPKAPNLDNPSIRELKENLPRAEQSYFGNILQKILFLSNPTSANSYLPIILSFKQAGYRMGTFSWQFLFTLYHSSTS